MRRFVRSRRTSFALAGALLTVALAAKSAEAVMDGTLVADVPWTLEVTAGANNNGVDTAVQVTFIGEASPAPGDLNALLLGLLSPQTTQGTTQFEHPIIEDGRFVYDVAPAP